MNTTLWTFFAFLPLLLALICLVRLQWPATRAMPLAWAAAAIIGIRLWDMPPGLILASTLSGFGSAVSVGIIVFGALLLLYTLRESGALWVIDRGFRGLSPDRRVQMIIVAMIFSSFLEGAAGFGTPAAIAAPLLMSLGFPAMAAAMCCLILNSFPVTFGAVGTPIWFGMQDLRPGVEAAIAQGSMAGVEDFSGFLHGVGLDAALLHLPMVFILPLAASMMLTRYFGPNRSWLEGLGVWRFSLPASTAFGSAYVLTAFVFGPEFPAMAGGLAGLAVTIPAARLGFFLPARTWDFGPTGTWDPAWSGRTAPESANPLPARPISLFWAWLPYILIGLILVAARVDALPIKAWLQGIEITFTQILGYENVSYSIQPLYLPGTIPFMLVAVLTIFLHGMSAQAVARAWKKTAARMRSPLMALLFAVALVEIYKNSALNPLDLPSMPMTMAMGAAALAGSLWPMAAPFVGALGSFITGSNTVSNLLFSGFQYDSAVQLGLDRTLMVALQAVGGAMGNMICIHNIVAVCATVGLINREGPLVQKNALPLLLYGLAAGALGLTAARL